MKLKYLKLKNFRQYYGEQTIRFVQGTHSDGVLNAEIFGEGAFKLAHSVTCTNPFGGGGLD